MRGAGLPERVPQSGERQKAAKRAGHRDRSHEFSGSLIAWIVIGVVAGWLAGMLVKGGGFGLIGDIIVGVIGAFIGGWLAGVLHISVGNGWVTAIVTAAIGAVLLVILRLVRSSRLARPAPFSNPPAGEGTACNAVRG